MCSSEGSSPSCLDFGSRKGFGFEIDDDIALGNMLYIYMLDYCCKWKESN